MPPKKEPKVGGAMEKVKTGKGSNKKKRKKKEDPKQEDPNFVTEVDKTFYELQITDLNRKLARLRSLVSELEIKNEELTKENLTLDEDRADVIAFLKRSLLEKENEILDIQERLKAIQEVRQNETVQFEEKIKELELEYKTMHEQLTSEAKLLQGKLNSLEEFRIQRDELMRKYEDQEKAMEEQEVKHKREIYEIERKFIIGKDKLKKEMEARLLQLSTDFQDATEVRIASTTHRVIRENIAINNELDLLLETQNRLQEENEQLKQKNKVYRLETELHEVEKKKAVRKAKVQTSIIERLTHEHGLMVLQVNNLRRIEEESKRHSSEVREYVKEITILKLNVRILEQNLHANRCECVALKTDLDYLTHESDRLTVILCTAVKSIKETLEIEKTKEEDESLILAKRSSLLTNLLDLLSHVEDKNIRRPSMDSVESITATYFRGDLGFVPKKQDLKYKYDIRKNMCSQVGASFEEFAVLNRPSLQMEREGEDMSSEAQLRIISDPEMLRHLMKERQMKKEAEAREAEGFEEDVESITFYDEAELTEQESEEALNPMDMNIAFGANFIDTDQFEGLVEEEDQIIDGEEEKLASESAKIEGAPDKEND